MQKKSDIEGLRVALTGGTSGLGLALVRLLRSEGARVAFIARESERVLMTANETGACGIVGDIGYKADIYPLALQVMDHLGGLDVLINNAASLGPTTPVPLSDTVGEDLELALAINLLGPFRITKALYGALKSSARDRGCALVINISSETAVNACPGWGAYGASKAGLRQMTAIWNEEARTDGVQLLSIDPGHMDTPLYKAAIPDADPATLKHPGQSAAETVDRLRSVLSGRSQAGVT